MEIKIVQWNIWCREDIDKIVEELMNINADICCLQELSILDNDNSKIEKLNKIYPFIYYFVADNFYGKNQCNAIISKYPLINTKKYHVQNPTTNKTDASLEGRVYIEADVLMNDYIIKIGTTHLSYTDCFIETSVKDLEVENLIKIIKKYNSKFIFTGDLNTTKNSNYINKIKEYLVYHETANTWTTKPFSYRGFIENELNWKLDYIFTTPDLNVLDIEVYQTKVSDHLPIIIKIII